MSLIDLSEREIEVLRSALDSAEYWEHKDQLPHNSGFILDPDMLVDHTQEEIDAIKGSEAWQEVQEIRALDARLRELEEDRCSYRCCGDPCVLANNHDGQHAFGAS